MRKNWSNTGKPFEKLIKDICSVYESLGILRMVKVDPPVRIIGRGKMLFMANELPDFVGCDHTGRMLAIEAKSTAKKFLPLNRPGGVTANQNALLSKWRRMGAIAGVLWETGDRVWWLSADTIQSVIATGGKSATPALATPIPRGNGYVIWDFAPTIGIARIIRCA